MDHSIPRVMAEPRRQQELLRASRDWPSWTLTTRQLGDLELILSGAYAPLDRFMGRAEAEACARDRRLSDGAPFPTPVTLEVTAACAADAASCRRLVLRDPEGVGLAVLDVTDTWRGAGHFVGGSAAGLQMPRHLDAVWLRHTPAEVAREIRRRGWSAAVAFPTRGIIHRGEHDVTARAISRLNGGHVVIASSDPTEEDAKRLLRLQCLDAVLPAYAADRVLIWLLPLPRREDPVDDLLLAATAARNGGCTHVLSTAPLDGGAAEAVQSFCRSLNVALVHEPIRDRDEAFPEVARLLAATQRRRGFTLFFTGLSGSGKSTIANLVRARLLERTGRPVTLLDGDLVRQHLSSELGFSREHRDLNIRRIGFVASEITKHGGIAICAPIAPYDSIRREVRESIEANGGFVLVFVDTPLEVCEGRDRKGLYAKARAGLIREFTGISDPYEAPTDAEIVVRTVEESEEAAARRIVAYLEAHGLLAGVR